MTQRWRGAIAFFRFPVLPLHFGGSGRFRSAMPKFHFHGRRRFCAYHSLPLVLPDMDSTTSLSSSAKARRQREGQAVRFRLGRWPREGGRKHQKTTKQVFSPLLKKPFKNSLERPPRKASQEADEGGRRKDERGTSVSPTPASQKAPPRQAASEPQAPPRQRSQPPQAPPPPLSYHHPQRGRENTQRKHTQKTHRNHRNR